MTTYLSMTLAAAPTADGSKLPNDTRLKELRAEIREYGRDSASGKDSKMKMAMKIAYAAHDGVIGDKDAEMLYTDYVTAESNKAIHEHTAAGKKANVSKLAQIIKASLAAPEVLDFPSTLNRIVAIRESMRQGERKVKGAFECAVDAARAQLEDRSAPLSDAVLDDICAKPESEAKDVLAKLCDEYKRLYSLEEKSGDELAGNSGQADVTDNLREARERIGDAITALGGDLPAVTKKDKAVQNLLLKAKKLGLVVAA